MEHCRISPCFFMQMYHMWAGASRQRLGITLEIRMKNKHITQKRVKEFFSL